MSAILLVAALVALNAMAWRHARAMTHFVTAGERTPRPEELSAFQKLAVLAGGVSIPKPQNDQTPASTRLAFETLTFRGAQGSELEAWLARSKAARGIILLFHGYASSKGALLAQAEVFHGLGWDVMLVDFHGSGGSSGDTTSIGWHEAEDVAAACARALELAPDRLMVLYGVSMGAAAILRAAAQLDVHPSAVILEAPFDRMLATAQNRFRTMRVPAFPAAQLLVFWGGRQMGFDGFANNPCDFAPNVTCPALHMHGTHDPRVTVKEARRVFDALGGRKTWVEFEHSGHQAYLSAEPAKWRETVEAFLMTVKST